MRINGQRFQMDWISLPGFDGLSYQTLPSWPIRLPPPVFRCEQLLWLDRCGRSCRYWKFCFEKTCWQMMTSLVSVTCHGLFSNQELYTSGDSGSVADRSQLDSFFMVDIFFWVGKVSQWTEFEYAGEQGWSITLEGKRMAEFIRIVQEDSCLYFCQNWCHCSVKNGTFCRHSRLSRLNTELNV